MLMRRSLGLITTEMVASVVAGVEVSVEEEGEVTGAEVVAVDATEDVDAGLEEGVEGVTEAVEAGAHPTGRALVQLVQVNSTVTSQLQIACIHICFSHLICFCCENSKLSEAVFVGYT
jgi:hypothetical protein